jgi:hypothetical protein
MSTVTQVGYLIFAVYVKKTGGLMRDLIAGWKTNGEPVVCQSPSSGESDAEIAAYHRKLLAEGPQKYDPATFIGFEIPNVGFLDAKHKLWTWEEWQARAKNLA